MSHRPLTVVSANVGDKGAKTTGAKTKIAKNAPAAVDQTASNVQEEREGRYKRIYLRSSLPAVSMVLEVGSRTAYVTQQPINWGGEENSLQHRMAAVIGA